MIRAFFFVRASYASSWERWALPPPLQIAGLFSLKLLVGLVWTGPVQASAWLGVMTK